MVVAVLIFSEGFGPNKLVESSLGYAYFFRVMNCLGVVHKLSTLISFWLFLTPLRWHFLPYKSQHFWTTYPPPLVNVVCERPLSARTPDHTNKQTIWTYLFVTSSCIKNINDFICWMMQSFGSCFPSVIQFVYQSNVGKGSPGNRERY